jgi:hypothetical protein
MDRFNIKFILENETILALISFNGKNVRPSTGIKVKSANWEDSKESQYVKKGDPDYKIKNAKLAVHLKFLDELLKDLEYSAGINQAIKERYNFFKKPHYQPKEVKKENSRSLLDFYREWVFDCAGLKFKDVDHAKFLEALKNLLSVNNISEIEEEKGLSKNTLKNYRNTYNILIKFELAYFYPLTVSAVNFEFERKFKSFILEDLEQDIDTHCKHIGIIKTFCKWLFFVKRNRDLPLDYQVFKRQEGKQEDIPSLDVTELMQLHNVCFLDEQLEKARLIFLTLCSTAVHISDYNEKLAPSIINRHKTNEYLELRRKKTGSLCIIPFFDSELFRPYYYTDILIDKYGKLPTMKGGDLNDYLAEIQQELGLTRIRLTSKVGRKTFASLCIFHLKMAYATVMKTTGHTTYRSFEKYLGIQRKDIVRQHKEANNVTE